MESDPYISDSLSSLRKLWHSPDREGLPYEIRSLRQEALPSKSALVASRVGEEPFGDDGNCDLAVASEGRATGKRGDDAQCRRRNRFCYSLGNDALGNRRFGRDDDQRWDGDGGQFLRQQAVAIERIEGWTKRGDVATDLRPDVVS